jgi:hypothetical protein
MRDLFGIEPVGLPDTRPGSIIVTEPNYAFLPVEGDGLHQIPVGPVHAGIIEPGHFRFTCDGETVVRLEERLGYVHKGVDALFARPAVGSGGAARLPGFRRQRGGAEPRLRPGGRGGAGSSLRHRARSGCGR